MLMPYYLLVMMRCIITIIGMRDYIIMMLGQNGRN